MLFPVLTCSPVKLVPEIFTRAPAVMTPPASPRVLHDIFALIDEQYSLRPLKYAVLVSAVPVKQGGSGVYVKRCSTVAAERLT